ncbi:hypothetical protein [Lacipirellula parvula]|uniref:Uncharacterized protein n=1 Tax=Lacipirellula parvula TaxID=2650471 RepID=A0A5K7XC90_9BACT|nr:hypothetical protein [Lacipirellula parvula]BBO34444.1 hypothetical protein PLANPX_4056 [Lacipirellula parvula]
MIDPDVEADWLQDTLAELAQKIRQPGVSTAQLAECASVLERIVDDLRGTQPVETPPVPARSGRTRWWLTVALGFGLFLMLRRIFSNDRNS